MKTLRVAVIGCGRVGSVLAHALHDAGWQVVAVSSRRQEQAAALAAALEPPRPVVLTAAAAPREADLTLITVPDDAVAAVAAAAAGSVRPGHVVCHTSGALTAGVLAPAREQGAHLLAAHPIQTLPDVETGLKLLPGTVWGLEGDREALPVGRAMVERLQGSWVDVPPGQKPAYHAACVLAANNLVGLAAQAARLLAEATGSSRDQALTALLPLMRGAVTALERQGLPGALTGPIQRGDGETVARHLDWLAAASLAGSPADGAEIEAVYRLLGRESLRLAKEAGGLDPAQVERIEVLLKGSGGTDA